MRGAQIFHAIGFLEGKKFAHRIHGFESPLVLGLKHPSLVHGQGHIVASQPVLPAHGFITRALDYILTSPLQSQCSMTQHWPALLPLSLVGLEVALVQCVLSLILQIALHLHCHAQKLVLRD